MNHTRKIRSATILTAAGAFAMTVIGCGKEEAPPPPPPKKVVVQPDPFDGLELDPRVQFPESRKPATQAQARAVASLANAIASGDLDAFRSVIDSEPRAIVAMLSEKEVWRESTSGIEIVRVCALDAPDASTLRVGLGVQDQYGAYLMAWTGDENGEDWTFDGLPMTPMTGQLASDFDGVALGGGRAFGQALVDFVPPEKEDDDDDDDKKKKDDSAPGVLKKPDF